MNEYPAMSPHLASAIRALRTTVEANEARRRGTIICHQTCAILDEMECREILAVLEHHVSNDGRT
jgi:hypothetical protein